MPVRACERGLKGPSIEQKGEKGIWRKSKKGVCSTLPYYRDSYSAKKEQGGGALYSFGNRA